MKHILICFSFLVVFISSNSHAVLTVLAHGYYLEAGARSDSMSGSISTSGNFDTSSQFDGSLVGFGARTKDGAGVAVSAAGRYADTIFSFVGAKSRGELDTYGLVQQRAMFQVGNSDIDLSVGEYSLGNVTSSVDLFSHGQNAWLTSHNDVYSSLQSGGVYTVIQRMLTFGGAGLLTVSGAVVAVPEPSPLTLLLVGLLLVFAVRYGPVMSNILNLIRQKI